MISPQFWEIGPDNPAYVSASFVSRARNSVIGQFRATAHFVCCDSGTPSLCFVGLN
jgi:hypothetical protein